MWKIEKTKMRQILIMVILAGVSFSMKNNVEQEALEAHGFELGKKIGEKKRKI